jgi:hypothetical protein
MAGYLMQQNSAAQLIHPPRKLKEKMGSGGLDAGIIAKAQQRMDTNTVDFRPIGTHLLRLVDEALQDTRLGKLRGKAAIQKLLYPIMELKAQGAMFHYPLITDISGTLGNFLETIPEISTEVLDLVTAYKMACTAIFSKNLTGQGGATGKQLQSELADVYRRFYKQI